VGRRLAKRFGSEKSIDDKTFIMTVTPGPVGDSTTSRPRVRSRRRRDLLRGLKAHKVSASWSLAGHGRVTRFGQTAQ